MKWIPAPPFWRWLLGVTFLGRPIGWSRDRYDTWLMQNEQAAVEEWSER